MTPEDEEFERVMGGGGRTAEDEEFERVMAPAPDYATKHPELQAKLDAATQAADEAHAYQSFVEKLATLATGLRGAARGYTGHLSELLPQAESWDAASERDPSVAMLTETGGAIASPFGRMLKGGGAFARGAANGLIQSGVETGVDAAQRGELSADDAVQVGLGGALGGAGELAGAGLRKAGDVIGEGLGKMATAGKNFVAGANSSVAKGIAKQQGLNAVDAKLGDLLESMSPRGRFGLGSSAKAQLENAINPAVAHEGENLRMLQGYIENNVVTPQVMDKLNSNVLNRLDDEAIRLGSNNPVVNEARKAAQIGKIRDAMLEKTGRYVNHFADSGNPLDEVVNRKSAFQSYAHSAPGGAVPEEGSKEAADFAGKVMRDEMMGVVDQAPKSVADAYKASSKRFQDLALLQQIMHDKATAESTLGDVGSIAASAVGASGVGALAGMNTDSEHGGLIGAGIGALGGAGSALFSGATRAAVRQLGSAVSDTGANWLRMGSNGFGAFDKAATAVEQTGRATTGLLGASKGHESSERVKQMMQLDPQGLGQYGPALQKAMQRGELAQEIDKISEYDPHFRMMLNR